MLFLFLLFSVYCICNFSIFATILPVAGYQAINIRQEKTKEQTQACSDEETSFDDDEFTNLQIPIISKNIFTLHSYSIIQILLNYKISSRE